MEATIKDMPLNIISNLTSSANSSANFFTRQLINNATSKSIDLRIKRIVWQIKTEILLLIKYTSVTRWPCFYVKSSKIINIKYWYSIQCYCFCF